MAKIINNSENWVAKLDVDGNKNIFSQIIANIAKITIMANS